jgi:hypothetical protein
MQSKYQLDNARKILTDQLKKMSNLLDTLESEAANLKGYEKDKFNKRLQILDDTIDVAVYYDELVFKYVRFHPAGHNTEFLEEQLKVAKQYIQRIGGNWDVVRWGKVSDY